MHLCFLKPTACHTMATTAGHSRKPCKCLIRTLAPWPPRAAYMGTRIYPKNTQRIISETYDQIWYPSRYPAGLGEVALGGGILGDQILNLELVPDFDDDDDDDDDGCGMMQVLSRKRSRAPSPDQQKLESKSPFLKIHFSKRLILQKSVFKHPFFVAKSNMEKKTTFFVDRFLNIDVFAKLTCAKRVFENQVGSHHQTQQFLAGWGFRGSGRRA